MMITFSPALEEVSWTWVVVSPPSCNWLLFPPKDLDLGSTTYSTYHGERKESKFGWTDCNCSTFSTKTRT